MYRLKPIVTPRYRMAAEGDDSEQLLPKDKTSNVSPYLSWLTPLYSWMSFQMKWVPIKETGQHWGRINLDYANMLAAFLHLVNAISTIAIAGANQDNSDWMFAGSFKTVDQTPVWHKGSFVTANFTGVTYLGNGTYKVPAWNNSATVPEISSGVKYVGSGDYYISLETELLGSWDVRWAVPSFFFLSFGFQLAASILPRMAWFGDGDGDFVRWNFVFRYIEYSFSATIMIVSIAVECGVYQWILLFCIAVLIQVTMLLGLVAELVFNLGSGLVASSRGDDKTRAWNLWMWVFPHFLSWWTCVTAYCAILYVFDRSTRLSSLGAPQFVYAIVSVEAFLFLCFGFVQTYELFGRSRALSTASPSDTNRDGKAKPSAEEEYQIFSVFTYICLSLMAKVLLGWLVFGPILAGTVRNFSK